MRRSSRPYPSSVSLPSLSSRAAPTLPYCQHGSRRLDPWRTTSSGIRCWHSDARTASGRPGVGSRRHQKSCLPRLHGRSARARGHAYPRPWPVASRRRRASSEASPGRPPALGALRARRASTPCIRRGRCCPQRRSSVPPQAGPCNCTARRLLAAAPRSMWQPGRAGSSHMTP